MRTLATKLLCGFLAVTAIGVLTAVLAIYGLASMEGSFTDIVRKRWVAADMYMEYWIGSLTKVWSLHNYLEGDTTGARETGEWGDDFVKHTLSTLALAVPEESESIAELTATDRRNDELRLQMIARFDEERELRSRFWTTLLEMNEGHQALEDRMSAATAEAIRTSEPPAMQRAFEAADSAAKLRVATLTLSSALGLLEKGEAEPATAMLDAAHRAFSEESKRLGTSGQVVPASFDRMVQLHVSLESTARRLFDANQQRKAAMVEFDRSTDRLEAMVKPKEDRHDEAMSEAGRRAIETVGRLKWAVLLLTAASAVAAVGIGLFLARGLTAPLAELSRAARDIATGELGRRVKIDARDEVGELARAFNGMAANLAYSNARIQQSEAAYRNLFDNAVVGLYRADTAGTLKMANRRLLEILGSNSEEGSRADVTLPPRFVEVARWRDLLALLESQGEVRDFETEMRRSDGSRRSVILSARREPTSGTIEGTLQDVTERRLLEQQIVQKEKLSAIGQLAAGISHEMRNPLGIVSNVLYDLRQIVDMNNPEIREDFSIATEEVNRLNSIIGNLLEFSRESGSEAEPVDINRLVDRTLQLMAKSLANQNIRVDAKLAELPLAQFNGNAFKQVFINLLTNAAQAMPEGGQLAIRSRLAGGRIALEVEDTGTGIPPNVLPQIFNPFFTTKPAGKGTGLGLSIVHSAVRKYDGDIRVESTEGKGTVFTLYLPVARPSAEAPSDGSPRETPDERPATRRDPA